MRSKRRRLEDEEKAERAEKFGSVLGLLFGLIFPSPIWAQNLLRVSLCSLFYKFKPHGTC